MKKKTFNINLCNAILCQNSLYVTAEAASVIQIEIRKATKRARNIKWKWWGTGRTLDSGSLSRNQYWVWNVLCIWNEFNFEISDEEKNLIATDLMCEYMNGRYYLIYDDKVLYYSVEADGMHKIMAYDEKNGMIKRDLFWTI